MAGAGLFDGAITQMEGMFEKDVKPMFDALSADLQAIQGTDAHLDATIAALDAHLMGLDAHIKGLTARMAKANAHPLLAPKAPPA